MLGKKTLPPQKIFPVTPPERKASNSLIYLTNIKMCVEVREDVITLAYQWAYFVSVGCLYINR